MIVVPWTNKYRIELYYNPKSRQLFIEVNNKSSKSDNTKGMTYLGVIEPKSSSSIGINLTPGDSNLTPLMVLGPDVT